MHLAPKIFIALLATIIVIAFFAPTLVLMREFQAGDTWLTFLATDSHLFLYFATFGLIALVAFYLPCLIALDFYWQHARLGKLRVVVTLLGSFLLAGLAATAILSATNKPAWEIRPDKIYSDRGEPAKCAQTGTCTRLPVLDAFANLQTVGQDRGNLKPFVRHCVVDTWIKEDIQSSPERLCIASTRAIARPNPTQLEPQPLPKLTNDETCCASQASLMRFINIARNEKPNTLLEQYSDTPLRIVQRYDGAPNRSLTGDVHAFALPFKIFFFLVLLATSIAITLNFGAITTLYSKHLAGVELGLLIGTPAVLLFPLMSQAFLFGNEALFGDVGHGVFSRLVPLLSLIFGLWTMLILLFFYRGRNKESELAAKIIGACIGAITLIKYEAIVAILMKIIGVGANWKVLLTVAVLSLVVALFTGWKVATARNTRTNEEAAADA